MTRGAGIVLIGAIGMCALCGNASAQGSGALVDASGRVERRESLTERRVGVSDVRRMRADGVQPAKNAENYARLLPSAVSNDAATSFSLGGQYVRDTGNTERGGQFGLTVRGGYKVGRRNATEDHSTGFAVGSDFQLNRNSDAFGQFIVSGDAGGVINGVRNAAATVEWDYGIGAQARFGTFVGSASYARVLTPNHESLGDIVPALAYQLDIASQLTLYGDYTFENDLDAEDDFTVAARFKLGTSGLRFAAGKHGRVSVTLIQPLFRR